MPYILKLLKYYKVIEKIVSIIKFLTMSDAGYLNNNREKRLAKALDGFFDFKRIKKEFPLLWGLINIKVGSVLEKNDYKAFLWLIRLIDDGILAKNENDKVKEVLDNVLTLLEAKDLGGFNNYVADILVGKIDIPLVSNDKQLFLQALGMFSGLLNFLLQKVDEAVAKAESEQ